MKATLTKAELERCRTSATALKWVRAIALAVLILAVVLILSGCDGMRIAGKITTSYGSISSDGKTITLEADTSGFSK